MKKELGQKTGHEAIRQATKNRVGEYADRPAGVKSIGKATSTKGSFILTCLNRVPP